MNNTVGTEKSTLLKNWLTDLNDLLKNVELAAIKSTKDSLNYPICFVVGTPGSGTMLLMQFLSTTNVFSYPSNFISRFYEAPVIGSKIQRLITDPMFAASGDNLEYKDKYSDSLSNLNSLLSPNIFFEFWQRFFPFKDIFELTKDELKNIDFPTIIKELSAIESVFNKPLLLNISLLAYHIKDIINMSKNFFIIEIKRKTFYSIQSILKSRKLYLKDINKWFSIKPPEYNRLSNLSPYKQVSGQLYYVDQAINRQLEKIDANRILSIDYDELVSSPGKVWSLINDKYNNFGFTLHNSYNIPKTFKNNNKVTLQHKEKERVVAAYFSMFGEDISPKN